MYVSEKKKYIPVNTQRSYKAPSPDKTRRPTSSHFFLIKGFLKQNTGMVADVRPQEERQV